MQIMLECLLQWYSKTQKAKGKGAVWTVLAVAPADEDQARTTLHVHLQIWTKELSQDLRDKLFHADHDVKTQSREKLCQHIDDLMNETYGSELQVIHTCNGDSVQTCLPRPVHEIYQEKALRFFATQGTGSCAMIVEAR